MAPSLFWGREGKISDNFDLRSFPSAFSNSSRGSKSSGISSKLRGKVACKMPLEYLPEYSMLAPAQISPAIVFISILIRSPCHGQESIGPVGV